MSAPLNIVQRALDGVRPLVAAAVGTSAKVLDGPPRKSIPQNYVAIGIPGPQGEAAVTYEQTPIGLKPGQATQTGEIYCEASCSSGSGSLQVIRDRTFALVNAIEAVIDADNRPGGHLGGVVLRAWLTGASYAPTENAPGPTAVVNFAIRFEAMKR